MAAGLPSGFSDLRAAGLYLPGVILLAIWHQSSPSELPVLGVVSILGAVAAHGRLRAVFGQEGPTGNPLKSGVKKQRMLVALSGKGPADLFADNIVDIFLNGHVYWRLLSRRKRVLALSYFALSLCWWVSLPLSVWRVWESVDSLPTTVLLLTVVLVIWFLQQFVIWRYIGQAHHLEQNPSENYDIPVKGVSQSKGRIGPSRPCDWMDLEDVAILEALSRKSYPISGFCASLHTELEKQLGGGNVEVSEPLGRILAYASFSRNIEYTENRLKALAGKGLVRDYGNDSYIITELGKAYLSGSVPPSLFE